MIDQNEDNLKIDTENSSLTIKIPDGFKTVKISGTVGEFGQVILGLNSKGEWEPIVQPKRKIKKTIERWMNVYSNEHYNSIWITRDLADVDAAWNRRGDQSIDRIACVKLVGEYEIVEE